MILIVAHDGDAHGAEVISRLEEAGMPWRRLDPSRLQRDWLYSIDPVNGGVETGRVFSTLRSTKAGCPDGAEVFHAVYWRRPVEHEDRLRMHFPLAREVAGAEAYHAFRLAVSSMPASFFPLGHPDAMERASNKRLQLRLAREMGMKVPETLVGNDPEAIASFLKRHLHVVVKPLHASAAYRENNRGQVEQLLWCRGIDADQLRGRLAPGQSTQLMLQEAIAKRRDWRVTVLPQRTILCEIDTSSLAPDQPDWRKCSMDLPHAIVDVPPHFDRQLRAYLAALGLSAGYFDFGVGEDGEPVFFEVNTNAQWLWIERLTGFSISREIAFSLSEDLANDPDRCG
jgi:glutathione synthase/RimK-type ligase-like ATP-grasp enzyme